MRFIAPLASLLLLTACATAAPSSPAAGGTTPSGPAGSASSARQAQVLRNAGGPEAPSLQDVERSFGQADVMRRDGAGTALTYRFETCALLLLFAADARNAMRLQEAHPSARQTGGATPSLEQCAAEAASRR